MRKRLKLVQQQIGGWLSHLHLHSVPPRTTNHSERTSGHNGRQASTGAIGRKQLDDDHQLASAIEMTHPHAYSALLASPPPVYHLQGDPRLAQQHGPRPPGGLLYLQNHFPERQLRDPQHQHSYAPNDDTISSPFAALGVLSPPSCLLSARSLPCTMLLLYLATNSPSSRSVLSRPLAHPMLKRARSAPRAPHARPRCMPHRVRSLKRHAVCLVGVLTCRLVSSSHAHTRFRCARICALCYCDRGGVCGRYGQDGTGADAWRRAARWGGACM